MSERDDIVDGARTDIHIHTWSRLIETYIQRVQEIHKYREGEKLSSVCVPRKDESHVVPLYCLHCSTGLVG